MNTCNNVLAWRIFSITAQTLSISKAAIELGLDIKTASRLLKNLETELDFQLFDRSARPLKLTAHGTKVLKFVNRFLVDFDDLFSAIEKQKEKKKEVILSLPVNMTREDLFSMLDTYRTIDPTLSVKLVNDCDHQHLLDSEVDMVLLPYLPKETAEMLIFDAGFSFNMLLASPEYLKAQGIPNCIKDLRNHRLILRCSRIYPTTTCLQSGDCSVDISGFNIDFLGDAMSCRQAALCGRGIAVDLSLAYCREDIRSKRLIPVLPGWHRPRWNMTVAIRKSDGQNKKLSSFAKWFAYQQRQAYSQRWRPLYDQLGVTP